MPGDDVGAAVEDVVAEAGVEDVGRPLPERLALPVDRMRSISTLALSA